MKEVGKKLSSARDEVVRTAEYIRYTAEEGKRVHGTLLQGDSFHREAAHKTAFVSREPLGIVLAIAPFNYPVNLAATKIAPALMGGNGVVFKPATQGAISGTMLIEALVEAGLNSDLVRVVTGKGGEIGDYLVTHPDIHMISFTGSTDVGIAISKKAQMIPIILELGGKDAAIVLEDADVELAANQIVSGAFSYSGQRCTAIKRVIVLNAVAGPLIESITSRVNKLKVGRPDQEADITPLIDEKSADFVSDLIDDALEKGACLLTTYTRDRNLISPVVLDHVTREMRVAWEEPFGPVLPIIRVDSEQEAIDLANESKYGLQASLFTNHVNKALSLSSRLEVGSVQINGRTERGPDHFPFLGVKKSGLGVQSIQHSILSMTREKVIIFNM